MNVEATGAAWPPDHTWRVLLSAPAKSRGLPGGSWGWESPGGVSAGSEGGGEWNGVAVSLERKGWVLDPWREESAGLVTD